MIHVPRPPSFLGSPGRPVRPLGDTAPLVASTPPPRPAPPPAVVAPRCPACTLPAPGGLYRAPGGREHCGCLPPAPGLEFHPAVVRATAPLSAVPPPGRQRKASPAARPAKPAPRPRGGATEAPESLAARAARWVATWARTAHGRPEEILLAALEEQVEACAAVIDDRAAAATREGGLYTLAVVEARAGAGALRALLPRR